MDDDRCEEYNGSSDETDEQCGKRSHYGGGHQCDTYTV